jgi:putative lipoprotein
MMRRLPHLMLALLGPALMCCATAALREPLKSPHAGVLKGSVSYRERMALPSDAVMEVELVDLVDVSRQEVDPPVVAEATVFPEGRQVPLPFELRYDQTRIDPSRSYAVRATIRSGAQMLFTTDMVYRVITEGSPTEVDLWLVRVGARTEGATSDGLWGTAWRLVELGGAGVLDGVEATLEFPQAGRASGNGSCNRFFGSVEISGESISFSNLGSTQMGCADEVAHQEAEYFKALQGAERFGFDGSALLIHSKDMDGPLRFVRAGAS